MNYYSLLLLLLFYYVYYIMFYVLLKNRNKFNYLLWIFELVCYSFYLGISLQLGMKIHHLISYINILVYSL